MGYGVSLIRFVHTADLHLDRQFRGIRGTPSRVSDALRAATFDTFQNIIDFTIEQNADALLISGDVYDGEDRSLRAQLHLIEGLERLDAAGIRAFICHGHADPLDDWTSRMRFPPLVHRFGPVPEAVPVDSNGLVEIVGISNSPSAPIPNLPQVLANSASAPHTIGMFYGDVDPWRKQLPDLAVNYWALGMRHKRQIVRAGEPNIVYPGTPQAVQPYQAGPCGVYLVEIEEGGATTARFHALDSIRWAVINVDISDVESEAALLEMLMPRVEERLEAARGRPLLYQIMFHRKDTRAKEWPTSPQDSGTATQLNELFSDRADFAWCYRIERHNTAPIERQTQMQADSIVAQLLRLSADLPSNPDIRQRLRDDLSILLSDDRISTYHRSSRTIEDELSAIVRRAETLALEVLGTQA
jgi:DNA repair exonuclease SbcCD nuclease subunit